MRLLDWLVLFRAFRAQAREEKERTVRSRQEGGAATASGGRAANTARAGNPDTRREGGRGAESPRRGCPRDRLA